MKTCARSRRDAPNIVSMRILAPIGLAAAIGSCGGARSSPTATGPVAPSVVRPASDGGAAPEPRSDRRLARSAVRVLVAQGLGAFLQRIELDEHPVLVGGRFHGFRVAALHDPSFWRDVDLRPGDVVTSINGFPIERPEQALNVFDSLDVASELRVAYERDGQSREIVYPIVDDR
jgi:hypothetical protein